MTETEPNLARHLASVHADGLALIRTMAENQEAHKSEHAGPGTIRNHDPQDLSWNRERLDQVIAQSRADDPTFHCPETVLFDPDAHPVHRMYAEINTGVRDRGEIWSKCANCGDPYQLTDGWGNSTVCSLGCGNAYSAYLNGPVRF